MPVYRMFVDFEMCNGGDLDGHTLIEKEGG